MIPIVSVKEMRACDARTIADGVSSRELMRRAGEGIYRAYDAWGKTAVVCGGGNNAGDGYVLAMFLQQNGFPVTLVRIDDTLSSDGRFYYEQCVDRKIEVRFFDENFDFSPYDTLADCLFGTGFHGNAQGAYAACIRAMNASGKPIVSADINSGISGDSGRGDPVVKSALTVSVQFYQPGHFLGLAKDSMKKKTSVDIGIRQGNVAAYLCEASDFAALFPKRANDSHKGTYGYVALLGGCTEYCGAVKLSNLSCAALRAGCGVIKLATAESLAGAVTPYLLESTFFPMPDDRHGHMAFNEERLDELFRGTKALGCGMGWGSGKDNAAILTYILKHYTGRLVLDADGLNTLAKLGADLLHEAVCESIVLTPHPLEFSRLSGKSMEEIQADPIAVAKEFAARFDRTVLLLKGTATVVTDGSRTYVIDRGCAGMATAGSGDVLSGVLVGLSGSREISAETVACAAYCNGVAGEMASAKKGELSMLASDTVDCLADAFRLCHSSKNAENTAGL